MRKLKCKQVIKDYTTDGITTTDLIFANIRQDKYINRVWFIRIYKNSDKCFRTDKTAVISIQQEWCVIQRHNNKTAMKENPNKFKTKDIKLLLVCVAGVNARLIMTSTVLEVIEKLLTWPQTADRELNVVCPAQQLDVTMVINFPIYNPSDIWPMSWDCGIFFQMHMHSHPLWLDDWFLVWSLV